jgi:hypothetical protein
MHPNLVPALAAAAGLSGAANADPAVTLWSNTAMAETFMVPNIFFFFHLSSPGPRLPWLWCEAPSSLRTDGYAARALLLPTWIGRDSCSQIRIETHR